MNRARAQPAMPVLSLCLGLLGGCAWLPPAPAPVVLPAEAPLAASGGGGSWPSARWWQAYRDPTLDSLIDIAVAFAPTLATAHARFDSARQSVRLAGAAAGAHVDLNGSVERQRLSDNGLFSPRLLGFSWYDEADLGLQARYTFDWWGKQRAAVEAAVDEARAADAERSAAALVLASSVADAYFGWQGDEARLALARERLATVRREAAIAVDRMRTGVDSAQPIHRTDAALAAARAAMVMLEGSAKLRVIALAALVGRSTADLPRLTPRPLPVVAAALPADVRIDLIARRADITASRWRVAAAAQRVKSARADFFPDVSIRALAGLSSIDVGKLLEYGSRVPLASAAVHLPLFDSGLLKARYGASRVQLRSAVAAYRQTLVDAARDVAAQAAAREQVSAQRAQRVLAVDAARQIEAGAAARVHQGIIDQRAELAAAESWIEQRDALVQLDVAALTADIALQRALGGGYTSAPHVANLDSMAQKATP